MIRPWRLRLIYTSFTRVLGSMVLLVRSDTAKEIEIVVLRHQLAVLRRPRLPDRRFQISGVGSRCETRQFLHFRDHGLQLKILNKPHRWDVRDEQVL